MSPPANRNPEKPARGEGREKLIAAAKQLLWEHGYAAVSPRDVLARSGVGQGSLYHHFPGKLDLAVAALTEMAEEERAAMDAIFAPAKPPLTRLGDYLRRQRLPLRGCRLGRLTSEDAMAEPRLRAPVAAFLDHVEALIGRTLSEAQAAGDLPASLDRQAFAALLLSAVEGGYVLARGHWDEARMERALRGAEAMLSTLTIRRA